MPHFESIEHSKMCNAMYQIRVKISELSISSWEDGNKNKKDWKAEQRNWFLKVRNLWIINQKISKTNKHNSWVFKNKIINHKIQNIMRKKYRQENKYLLKNKLYLA